MTLVRIEQEEGFFLGVPMATIAAVHRTIALLRTLGHPQRPRVARVPGAKDPRVRTISVTPNLGMLLFDISDENEEHYIVRGVYDNASLRTTASRAVLRVNDITGATEIRDSPPDPAATRHGRRAAGRGGQRRRRTESVNTEATNRAMVVPAERLFSERGINTDLSKRPDAATGEGLR